MVESGLVSKGIKPRWLRMLWLGKLPVSDGHIGLTAGGFLVVCRSVRRIPERFTKELHDVLRDQPYTQAAFLAGHMGQARVQRTPIQEPQAHLQAEVVPPGRPDPPQRLLPDSAMLSELVPDHLQPPLHDDARPRLSEANPVSGSAASDVVPDRVARAAEPDTAEPEPRKRLRLMAVSKVGDEEFYT